MALAIVTLAFAPLVIIRAGFLRMGTLVEGACGVPLTHLVDADGTRRTPPGDPKDGGSLPAVLVADSAAVAAIRITRTMVPEGFPIMRWSDAAAVEVCLRNSADGMVQGTITLEGAEFSQVVQEAWAEAAWTGGVDAPTINGPRPLPTVTRWSGGDAGPLDGRLVMTWAVTVVAAGTIQLTGIGVVIGVLVRGIRRRWRLGRDRCPECGYVTVAGSGATCSECGDRSDRPASAAASSSAR